MGKKLAFVASASTTPHIPMVGWESVAILPVPTTVTVRVPEKYISTVYWADLVSVSMVNLG